MFSESDQTMNWKSYHFTNRIDSLIELVVEPVTS